MTEAPSTPDVLCLTMNPAVDLATERGVLEKAGASSLDRLFRAEAQATAAFSHPNIVTIHHVGEHDELTLVGLASYEDGGIVAVPWGVTREDIREIKTRLGRLESEVANLHGFLAEQSIRLDRFGDRLERVERRLEIADG